MAEASPQEKETLETSRIKFLEVLEAAKESSPDAPSSEKSLGEKIKSVWHATNEVAYDYIQMLDVMVGQATEYVGLAYGAIKIILIVQINHEEMKRKLHEYLDQVQHNFVVIDHLTAYIPSHHLVTLVSRAYSLFYRFLSKAVKHYTQSRASKYSAHCHPSRNSKASIVGQMNSGHN